MFFLFTLFAITLCLTPFNHTWFQETSSKDEFPDPILRRIYVKYEKTPNQFRCINGDGCDNVRSTNMQIFCTSRPHPSSSLFELKCGYYGIGLRMENLEIQCNYNFSPDRQCVTTYDLWKTENYSFLDNWLSSWWGLARFIEESAKGVMMNIDYAYEHDHFNKTTWKEIYDGFEYKDNRDDKLFKYISF